MESKDDHGGGHPADVTATAPSKSSIAADQNNHFQNKDKSNADFDNAHYDVADDDDIIVVHDSSLNDMNNYNTNNSMSSASSNGAITSMSMMTTTSSRGGGGGVSEITEIIEEAELVVPSTSSNNNNAISNVNRGQLMPVSENTSLFSIDINKGGFSDRHDQDHVVYVAVGKSETSMDALLWTLDHAVIPATSLVYLIHIFPELKFIPSPLGGGRVPKSQVSPELAETYLAQDRSKTRELLRKYMDKCNAHLVQVETILIESDSVANAIVELISVLDISKLVVGISKSNLRKLRGGKGSGIVADEILQSATVRCEVKIICQGKDVSELGDEDPSSPLTLTQTPTTKFKSPAAMTKVTASATTTATSTRRREGADSEDDKHPNSDNNSFSCCFRPTF